MNWDDLAAIEATDFPTKSQTKQLVYAIRNLEVSLAHLHAEAVGLRYLLDLREKEVAGLRAQLGLEKDDSVDLAIAGTAEDEEKPEVEPMVFREFGDNNA